MNTRYSIRAVLIERDGCEPSEADELITEARQAIADGGDPEEVLADFFGLEPDYVWELLS